MTELTPEARVKALALATGFDAVRITGPDAPDAHAPHVAAWHEAGMHATMAWLPARADLRNGRADDDRLLDGARSVMVLAASYESAPSPHPSPASQERGVLERLLVRRAVAPTDTCSPLSCEAGEGWGEGAHQGIIARYARVAEDYHTVLRAMLNDLAGRIADDFPGTRSRGFVDSGPIRERELAARAGLGWQGKHTNLISLDLGNFFFLAALLTTLELAPDPPFAGNHCGTCTRCLAACPTGALIAPLTLDARRCISYLTIEHRGPIPVELRALMGNRIFGCDDCLAACPWNDKARAGRNARLQAQSGDDGFPDLLTLLEDLRTDEGFRARFRGTPLLRPKREGLRRNVCIALGNVGGREALPPLEEVMRTDPSEVVTEAAQWAADQIHSRTDREPLRNSCLLSSVEGTTHETDS